MASMAENPVSHRYDVLNGIKNFRALSDSAVNSVLLFSQKLLKLSFLKSICNEPSQDSSISWSCS